MKATVIFPIEIDLDQMGITLDDIKNDVSGVQEKIKEQASLIVTENAMYAEYGVIHSSDVDELIE